jgi:hypothetical protein
MDVYVKDNMIGVTAELPGLSDRLAGTEVNQEGCCRCAQVRQWTY